MTAKLKAHLYCTAAVAMFMCAGAAMAQSDDDAIETVVVTGQRAAIQSAISIKEKADVIVDSVAAEDIGKLPDNSITEVLQRLPGVNISHMDAASSGENYLGEGTGVTIRGLTSTVSLVNGRDSFSASNGRNLAWEDIPPELAQGVDVYKSLNASLPEGGFGGVVNLRTRQPFDFDGFTASLTATGNYADHSKKGHLGGVALISDRWQTRIGEFGLLLNVAYSDLSTMADGVQVAPYFPTAYNPTVAAADTTQLPSMSDSGSVLRYIPSSVSFIRRGDTRNRLGLYASAQWRPNEDLLLFATILRSRYTLNSTAYSMFTSAGDVITATLPGSTNTFDDNGNLTSTTGLGTFVYTATAGWGYQAIPYQLQTQYSHTVNTTTDFSIGGEWHPSDAFSANFALQFIDSASKQDDYGAVGYLFLSGYTLQLGSYGDSTLPKITLADDTVDTTNAENYGWLATMPHKQDNKGKEYAAYVDTVYTISDTGLFRQIRSGLKVTYREERDGGTDWNWKSLDPYWGTTYYSLASTDSSGKSYATQVDLSDLFGGSTGLPSSIWFPSVTAAKNTALIQSLFDYTNGYEGDETVTITPERISNLFETTLTGYAYATFASEDYMVPFNGNVGLRLVAYRDYGSGYSWTGGLYSYYMYDDYATYGTSALQMSADPEAVEFIEGSHSQVDALPSINVQFLPTPEMHVRFAFSQAVSRPTFDQLKPYSYLSNSTLNSNITRFSATRGNPNLKPEKAEQFDASVEYYFPKGGMVHFAAFYKTIHNYIAQRQIDEDYTFNATIDSGTSSDICSISGSTATCTVTAAVTEYFNEAEAATIDGFEIGLQKYADFLPDPFDGFGVDFNFTYIDSQQPGALAFDLMGDKIEGLPVTGLSKNTINVALMYDKGPLSLRVAYNWRNDYLVSTGGWQTAGTYNNVVNINYSGNDQIGETIHYALPVFAYPSGTLDANLSYNLTDDIVWTLQASNLTRETSRLYMGVGDRRVNRSWYQADTRYTTQLRVKF